jgi:hypothetical protein
MTLSDFENLMKKGKVDNTTKQEENATKNEENVNKQEENKNEEIKQEGGEEMKPDL